MKKTNKTEYWVVEIEFMDHAQCVGGRAEPAKCLVWGLLYEETATHYKICSWASFVDPNNENSDTYAILKHKTLKLRRLSRVRLWDKSPRA